MMTIRYIAVHMQAGNGLEESLAASFNLRNRFISNYLSKGVRKLKLDSGGKFNMISVLAGTQSDCRLIPDNAIQVGVGFDKNYSKFDEREKSAYVLDLIDLGYARCMESKMLSKLSYKGLVSVNNGFRLNDFKNEWTHKKKAFKELGIEVALDCFFTSSTFKLEIIVTRLKDGLAICRGPVFATQPHEVHFEKLFKDVLIKDNSLIITEFQDRPKFVFSLDDVLNGKLNIRVMDVGLKIMPP